MADHSAQNPRGARIYTRDAPEAPDRIRCRICGFPAVDVEATPGENFPTAFVVTGSTYVWTNSNDPLSGIDLQVLPEPDVSASCPFCGGTLFMSGSRNGS